MKHIVVYRCRNCGGERPILDSTRFKEHILSCSGQLEVIHILRALEHGAPGVLVIRCEPGRCGSIDGSATAEGRVRRARELLSAIPVDTENVKDICFTNIMDVKKELTSFYGKLQNKKS